MFEYGYNYFLRNKVYYFISVFKILIFSIQILEEIKGLN